MQKYSFRSFVAVDRTYEWYKTCNTPLSSESEEADSFLRMVHSIEIPCHEAEIPFWCMACRKNVRCFAVQMDDGDEVLVIYKVVNLMKSKFIHVVNIPISRNENDVNIRRIISELRRDQFVRFIFYEPFKKYYSRSERFENQDNYYIDMDELKSQCIDNSSWRKRSRINTFLNHPDVFGAKIFPEGIPDSMTNDIMHAREMWRIEKMRSKMENGSTRTLGGNSKKDMKMRAFLKCVSDRSGRILTAVLSCDGSAFAAETVQLFDGYAVDYFFVHAGRREEEDSLRRHIYHNSEDIMKYFLGKELLDRGIRRWYVLGSGGESHLSQHKMKLCNGHRVRFYIDKNF